MSVVGYIKKMNFSASLLLYSVYSTVYVYEGGWLHKNLRFFGVTSFVQCLQFMHENMLIENKLIYQKCVSRGNCTDTFARISILNYIYPHLSLSLSPGYLAHNAQKDVHSLQVLKL